jgi:predicted nuclease of predicted toxin-antitoxin system
VKYLSEAGFEAAHWADIGAHNATDAELLDWAAATGHIVLTADLDFGAILAATRGSRPSVVQVRSDILMPASIGDTVVRTLRQAQRQLAEGALISVDAAHARLRILPMNDET